MDWKSTTVLYCSNSVYVDLNGFIDLEKIKSRQKIDMAIV